MNKFDNEDNDAINDLKILNAEKKHSECDLNTYPRFRTDVFPVKLPELKVAFKNLK